MTRPKKYGEVWRDEPCGCRSYALDPNADEPFLWTMEATCNAHVYMFKKRQEEMDRHIKIDHPIKGSESWDVCNNCGKATPVNLLEAKGSGAWWCNVCRGVDTPSPPM